MKQPEQAEDVAVATGESTSIGQLTERRGRGAWLPPPPRLLVLPRTLERVVPVPPDAQQLGVSASAPAG
eukprot:SAG25_NODE_5_length_29351_cov_43.404335_47_plen_69_part_00